MILLGNLATGNRAIAVTIVEHHAVIAQVIFKIVIIIEICAVRLQEAFFAVDSIQVRAAILDTTDVILLIAGTGLFLQFYACRIIRPFVLFP